MSCEAKARSTFIEQSGVRMAKQNCEREVNADNKPRSTSPIGEHLKESDTSSDRVRDEVDRQNSFAVVRRQYSDEPDDGGWLAL